MTKIRILSFGNIKSYALKDLTNYYQKLVSKYSMLELVVCKDPGERKISSTDFQKIGYTVVLSDQGQSFDTLKFKEFIVDRFNQEGQITFLIGNAYGLDESALKQADLVLSLSPMTLNHELTFIILLEQLYRILNLHAGGKYHK
ncbi:hypothetical protein A2X44_00085 [candidate division CPR3 bacterium GWF2_35_18]|uniref:Ribosomal RNA large subunit methyltransferase H n=1 Tax=candidate division CPR3 bacterium GW2011_GWF2_35_18 TaxID=1618350 RepID=A0A0G0E443_UNCC3|nr:MAG: Ribosomal RNA large subunit methyltransferase H [candidate division CPR3 bacterium GW2011_GWF2_35_18]KKP85632.1 MAG: Ribosomal RNA large subunit methyltransferase H [candidate division CPR3 bacterium GW2011_GWE2_35_7]OGB63322.1 MAG: hypothetical protein A2X44_00085 [candidate division CPR3 bacterium GWF2_35_18]OGB65609.1 MAG: hypothetical protein A2250_02425 [candidate division CPR3 bacterium RIFOXYA2_FULL_35_13]OGB75572.1 MAG: hypothetical protein A2476_04410 [candidate division CPR3 b